MDNINKDDGLKQKSSLLEDQKQAAQQQATLDQQGLDHSCEISNTVVVQSETTNMEQQNSQLEDSSILKQQKYPSFSKIQTNDEKQQVALKNTYQTQRQQMAIKGTTKSSMVVNSSIKSVVLNEKHTTEGSTYHSVRQPVQN